MTTVSAPTTITVTPQTASNAYRAADLVGGDESQGFGGMLERAIEGAVATGHDADAKSMQAIAGGGNLTDVVTAVSKAQLTLQTAVTIRDKMMSAYQDVMKMPI